MERERQRVSGDSEEKNFEMRWGRDEEESKEKRWKMEW